MFHNETVHNLVVSDRGLPGREAVRSCAPPGAARHVRVRPGPAQSSSRRRRLCGAGAARPHGQRSSESFNVSVFLPQDGDLVFKEDGVEPHLRVDQRHIAKPAGESVHAALPLGEVVGVSPAWGPGCLCGEEQKLSRDWKGGNKMAAEGGCLSLGDTEPCSCNRAW